MNLRIILKKLFTPLFLISLLSVTTNVVQASELKFSVEPVIPENQLDKEHTYFDLLMKPEENQTIKVHMKNDTDKDVIVEADVNAATTNINGVVEYGKSNNKLDKTAPYDISDIVKPKVKEIIVPAKGASDLEIGIKMPIKPFEGKLAGGITLHEKEDPTQKNKQEEKKQGLAIENKYGYVLAILLQENKNEIPTKLDLIKVYPSQVNARNVINADLKNFSPDYINKLSVKTTISKKDKSDVLYSSKNDDMQMAPNTSFNYPIQLNGKKLEAGEYRISMDASSSKKKWHFEKEFKIASDTARNLNQKDVTIKKNNPFWVIGIGIALLVLILAISLRYWDKKHEKKKI